MQVVRKAAGFYRAESNLADHLGTPPPVDFFKRCEDLFSKTYGEQAKKVGLALNQATFEAIIRCEVPEEVLRTDYQELPTTWIFNPYKGWRRR